jgi:hypothetical protein
MKKGRAKKEQTGSKNGAKRATVNNPNLDLTAEGLFNSE